MMTIRCWIMVGIIASLAFNAEAALVAYIDQTIFLNDLSALGYTVVHEGFEDDTAWGGVRSTTTSNITNLGVTWTSNNLNSQVTTGSGAARSGNWGFYSLPHGSYHNPDPGANCLISGDCGDGFRGSANAGVLYGIGGWIKTNTPPAKLGLFIESYPDNSVDFGNTCGGSGENCADNALIVTPQYEFFGVIDVAGFSGFEFRELEGKQGDEKLIFADDFYFAGSHTVVPIPAAVWLLGSGLSLIGLLGFIRRSKIIKSDF